MVTVPETIIRSAWRGDAHGTMPKRSTSKREAKVAIISIAQQASPNVTGHIDDFRAQLKSLLGRADHEPAPREVLQAVGQPRERLRDLVARRPAPGGA